MPPDHYLHIILGLIVGLPIGIAIGAAVKSIRRAPRPTFNEWKRTRIFYHTRL